MNIAVIGPSAGRDTLLSLISRYAESICAEADVTVGDDLHTLPQNFWNLAFIYFCESIYDDYLEFISAHPDCEVVLWAEDDRLARIGLRSHPRDYLILPTGDEQFLAVMKKCQSWTDALRALSFSGAGSGRKIRCVEVQYVESVGHSCEIHCRDKVVTVNRGLSAVYQQLGPGFLRCHRGFVVNMRCVAELREKSLLLQGNEEVPLSPTQAADVSAEVRAYTQQLACFHQGGSPI